MIPLVAFAAIVLSFPTIKFRHRFFIIFMENTHEMYLYSIYSFYNNKIYNFAES